MVVGGLLTVGLGFGTTKLKFSTDQSNYLNKSDQIYKDNVAYQKLFGGEAMLTLVTMDPGHTVAELFTAGDIASFNRLRYELDDRTRTGDHLDQSGQPAHRGSACGILPADWSREARPDLRKGGVT